MQRRYLLKHIWNEVRKRHWPSVLFICLTILRRGLRVLQLKHISEKGFGKKSVTNRQDFCVVSRLKNSPNEQQFSHFPSNTKANIPTTRSQFWLKAFPSAVAEQMLKTSKWTDLTHTKHHTEFFVLDAQCNSPHHSVPPWFQVLTYIQRGHRISECPDFAPRHVYRVHGNARGIHHK